MIGIPSNGGVTGVNRSNFVTSAEGAGNFAHQVFDCPAANFSQTPGMPQE